MANREAQIKDLIKKEFRDIFETEVLANLDRLIKKIPLSEKGLEIRLPDVPPGVPDSGLPLEDGVGYISIQETFRGEVVSYVYRFATHEYECLFSGVNKGIFGPEDFCFHYDKDENNKPHSPHITVVLRSLRYPSKEIKLKEFLEFIRGTFFTMSQGKLCRKQGNIWDGRFE